MNFRHQGLTASSVIHCPLFGPLSPPAGYNLNDLLQSPRSHLSFPFLIENNAPFFRGGTQFRNEWLGYLRNHLPKETVFYWIASPLQVPEDCFGADPSVCLAQA